MTGGRVVVLGATGRNFAAGMSGGIAYVLDEVGDFERRCNRDMVDLEPLADAEDVALVLALIRKHSEYTQSNRAAKVLAAWDALAAEVRQGHAAGLPARPRRPGQGQERGTRADLERAAGGAAWVSRRDSWRSGASCPSGDRWRSGSRTGGRSTGEFPEEKVRAQGARCMDCGIPFCHKGCPLGNIIPDWNDLVYRNRWREALDRLLATNNFPEFTGRLCPAPCEGSCVLGINADPVTIKQIELEIIEHAFREGWVKPEPPLVRTGKSVAVVGSGPCGLAAADQLNRAGHRVTVFERADRIGGLLRYGIPEFKLEKGILDRRLKLMEAEGVIFRVNAEVGVNVSVDELRSEFDAVLLAGGAPVPRDLKVPGRELDGIHFAMEYLPQANRRCEGDTLPEATLISAKGKRVVIIGGGDTGADCLGTAHRQGAALGHSVRAPATAARVARRRTTPGRSGRTSSGCPRRTRKAASGTTASRRSASRAGTARWSVCTGSAWSSRRARTAGRPCGSCRGPSSRWRSTSCCWPWGSWAPSATRYSRSSA